MVSTGCHVNLFQGTFHLWSTSWCHSRCNSLRRRPTQRWCASPPHHCPRTLQWWTAPGSGARDMLSLSGIMVKNAGNWTVDMNGHVGSLGWWIECLCSLWSKATATICICLIYVMKHWEMKSFWKMKQLMPFHAYFSRSASQRKKMQPAILKSEQTIEAPCLQTHLCFSGYRLIRRSLKMWGPPTTLGLNTSMV